MNHRTRPPFPVRRCHPKGMTLAEVLVAMSLFGVVSTLLLGFAAGTARVTERTQADADVTEEARLAIQRLGRELRQASSVDDVTLADLGDPATAMTLSVDFNGDGVIDDDAYDPEILTYRWDPGTGNLTLTAHDPDGDTVTRPVLAGGVTGFDVRLRSSRWEHDADGDGITTWAELDASTLGNSNGRPDNTELEHVDIISVLLTVTEGRSVKTFTVQSDLRNQHPAP